MAGRKRCELPGKVQTENVTFRGWCIEQCSWNREVSTRVEERAGKVGGEQPVKSSECRAKKLGFNPVGSET